MDLGRQLTNRDIDYNRTRVAERDCFGSSMLWRRDTRQRSVWTLPETLVSSSEVTCLP